MNTQATLYELLGGENVIAKVVEEFYKKVLADDTVNSFFANTDMEKQKKHQTNFISFALGSRKYTGKSMAKAHEGMNLQPHHFNAIVTHLCDTLTEFQVNDTHIQAIVERLATLKEDILYK